MYHSSTGNSTKHVMLFVFSRWRCEGSGMSLARRKGCRLMLPSPDCGAFSRPKMRPRLRNWAAPNHRICSVLRTPVSMICIYLQPNVQHLSRLRIAHASRLPIRGFSQASHTFQTPPYSPAEPKLKPKRTAQCSSPL